MALTLNELKFASRAIHVGQSLDPTTNAVVMPIYQVATFVQTSPGKTIGYDYSRCNNPSRAALETNLASLEGGAYGICFSSGCAALSAVIHLLKSGDHIISSDDIYAGTSVLLREMVHSFNMEHTLADVVSIDAVEAAYRPNTKLIWLETPTNPLLKIADIEKIAHFSKKKGILFAVDNTFATPYLQNPLSLGADIVSHSTTKYLGGHSDIIGGALIVSQSALAEQLYAIQKMVGAVPAPMDCFLILRSTKTLHVRMQRHCENAAVIANYLASHSAVERVIYPGLSSHPQHALASKQMRDFGGMISFYLKGGVKEATQMFQKLSLFKLAVSLGGVESLVEHPATMTHENIPQKHREYLGITESMIRVSVGIEDVNDLVNDLACGLEGIGSE